MNLIIIAIVTAASIGSLVVLKREKKKYGNGLAAKTAHTASRYKLLWLLAYATATPAALSIHILHLAEWFYTGIGRLILWSLKKAAYTTLGFFLWTIILTVKVARYTGRTLWEWVA